MKRIAIISPTELPIPAVKGGAVETGIEQIIKENEKYGLVKIDIYSYYNKDAEDTSKKYLNSEFYYYIPSKFAKYKTIIKKAINKIFKILKVKISINIRSDYTKFIGKILTEKKYDAILIKNYVNYVNSLTKYTNDPIYLQLHNDFLNSSTPHVKKIVKNCTKIITNSEYIRKRVLTISNINPNDILVNMNCLDAESFKVPSTNDINNFIKEYNIDMSKKIILYSGRLIPEKGIKELLYAVSNITSFNNWQLIIVGSKWFGKNSKDKYSSELEELGKTLKNSIHFLGFVPHNKINIINYLATIVVVPSIWEEPAGRVVLEAQAVGTPVIVSDAGGIPEYSGKKSSITVKRGKNFVLNLTSAIESVLEDKIFTKNVSKTAIEFAKKFNSKRYYYEILSELNVVNEALYDKY